MEQVVSVKLLTDNESTKKEWIWPYRDGGKGEGKGSDKGFAILDRHPKNVK